MEDSVIVVGDFNARALEYGMPIPNSRGRRIIEMTARLGLIVLNTGTTTTFRRLGNKATILDISLAPEDLGRCIADWKVNEDYTGSDHQYISFQMKKDQGLMEPQVLNLPRWNLSKLDEENLRRAILHPQPMGIRTRCDPKSRNVSETMVMKNMRLIHQACKAAIPKRKRRPNQTPAYW